MTASPTANHLNCPHDNREQFPCVLCGTTTCLDCAFVVPENNILCPHCAYKMASAEDTSDISESNGVAPRMTFVLCGFLVGLYLLSSFPILAHARMDYLILVNLDIEAVKQGGEYWRLIAANLSHVNLMHLSFNVFSLLIFGTLLEKQIGKVFLSAWILAAIIGCDAASLYYGVTHSVGASGIAYGLQTGFIVLTAKTLILHKLQSVRKTLQSLLGYLLLIFLINTINTEQINVFGHGGGAVAGIVMAFAYPVKTQPRQRDYLIQLFLIGLLLAGLAWTIHL